MAEKSAAIDVLRQMVQFMAQCLMELDLEGPCGAEFHQALGHQLLRWTRRRNVIVNLPNRPKQP